MSEKLEVIVSGRDEVSKVFGVIADEAARAGDEVSDAGKRGAEGLAELADAAKDISGNLGTVNLDELTHSAEGLSDAVSRAGSETATSLAVIGDAGQEAAAALDAVGDSAGDMVGEVVNSGGEAAAALEDVAASARDLGEAAAASGQEAATGLAAVAASADEAGKAWEALEAEAKAVAQEMQQAGNTAGEMGQAIDDAGSQGTAALQEVGKTAKELDSSLQQVAKTLTGTGAVLTSAVAIPITAGSKAAWDQVRAVQQATVALRAYEKDAAKVDKVLQSLVAYARSDMGVLFQRADLFAAAQGLKIMGAETESLTRYVEIMSRSVGVGAGTWDELTRVIGRVGSTSRMAGEDFEMLTKMGFQLDESLRNTTITWDELFDALDRGIPADSMLGQVDMIDGQLIRFQSSVRNLGLAFLQVDRDTSQFIAGGLGDQLVQSLGRAREIMLAMEPTAAGLGQIAAIGAQGVSALVDTFLDLPPAAQTAAFSVTAVTGAVATAAGSLLLLAPRIASTKAALDTLGGVGGAFAMIGRSGPVAFATVGAAAVVATTAIAGMYQQTQATVAASKELDEVWRDLVLSGLDGEADKLKTVREEINGVIGDLQSGNFDWLPFGTGGTEVPLAIKEGISKNLAQAFTDARVDAGAFFDWVISEIARIGDDEDLQIEFLNKLADPNLLSDFTKNVDTATVALTAMAVAGTLVGASLDAIPTKGERIAASVVAGLNAIAAAGADAGAEQARAIQQFNDATTEWLSNGDNILDWWLAFDKAVNTGAASFSGTQQQYLEFMSAMQADAEFRGLVTLADNLSDAGSALNRILNVYSQIDALGQRSASASSIAENLVGEPGVWDEIDDMLQRGVISQTEYNSAVTAGHYIQQSNARVQEYLNEMRRDQLPLLAQEQAAYEKQIEAISQLPPLEQRRALAMQDSAVQAQLAEQYATAYAASIGEIPAEVATNMIVSAAEADPVLKDLLLQFGLIEEGADGEIRVNFPDGPTVQQTIMDLTDAIDRLYVLLGGDPLELKVTATDEATPVIEEVVNAVTNTDGQTATVIAQGDNTHAIGVIDESLAALNDLNGQSATVSVYANDFASGLLDGVSSMLAALDGRTATTYVRTVGMNETMAHGGIVGMAHGGMVPVWTNETGTEIAHLATGGMVPLYGGEGLRMLPTGTFVETAPSAQSKLGGLGGLTVNLYAPVYGNVYGVEDLTAEIMAPVADLMVDEIQRKFVAAGMVP